MSEAANIIVARAHITDAVELEPEAPSSFVLDAGQEIHLKFPFRYQEVSTEEDWFHLSLRAGFGGQMQEQVLDHKDVFGKADDKRGFIRVDLVAPEGGGALEYVAKVVYGNGEWKSPEHKVVDEAEVKGSIDINVL